MLSNLRSESADHRSPSQTVNRFIRVGLPPGKCLHVLRKISSTRGVLPSSCEVSGTLTPLAGSPVAYGGFCDVQRGSLSTRRTDDVCIKKLRMHNESNPEKIKKVSRLYHFLLEPLFADKF